MKYFIENISVNEVRKDLDQAKITLERFLYQQDQLLVTKAKSIASMPQLQATLGTPDADHKAVFYSGAKLVKVADTDLFLIIDNRGLLGANITDWSSFGEDLIKLPGVKSALIGSEFHGIWKFKGFYYWAAISPIELDGNVVGCIVLGNRADNFTSMTSIEEITGTEVVLVLENKTVKTHAKVFSREKNEVHSALEFEILSMFGDSGVPDKKFEYGSGSEHKMAVLVVQDAQYLTIVLARSTSDLDASLNAIKNYLLIVGVISLIIGLGLSFLLSAKLTQPIVKLTQAVKKHAVGDFSQKISLTSNDEIGALARAFNMMIDDIAVAQHSLTQAKEFSDNIVESMEDSVIVLDENGYIEVVNQATLALLGYSKRQLIGKPFQKIMSSEAIDLQQGIDLVTHNILLHSGLEYTSKSNTKIPMFYSASAMCDANQSLIAVVCNARDRRPMIKLLASKEAAESSSKIKSQFMASMSHEIRIPMTAIIGTTELLLNSKLDTRQRLLVDTAQRSANQLLRIINDILDFSKIEAGRLDINAYSMSLLDITENVNEQLAYSAHTKKIELVALYSDNLEYSVIGDGMRISQILINIVGNAIKFTSAGEVVTRVSVVAGDKQNPSTRFEVIDTGIGLLEDACEQVFDYFTQSDSSVMRQFGGTGLGLSISKQLVELMGGKIGVDSQLGKGSTFWFELPLPADKPLEDLHGDLAPVDINISINIDALIIEGHSITQKSIEKFFMEWNVRAQFVNNVTDALLLSQEGKTPFELVIIDERIIANSSAPERENLLALLACYHNRALILHSMDLDLSLSCSQFGLFERINKPVRKNYFFQAITELISADKPRKETKAPSPVWETNFDAYILVVEDGDANQLICHEILTMMGCSVDIVENGKLACEAWANKTYDLIFMDCQMPIMSGYQAAQSIRESEKCLNNNLHIPIVALTANAMNDDKAKCLEAGMDDYIAKPFSPEQIRLMLEKWIKNKIVITNSVENENLGSGLTPYIVKVDVFDEVEALKYDDPKLLGREILQKFNAIQRPGRPDVTKKIIDYYLQNTPESMEVLQRAVANNDMDGTRFEAHSLKSSSLNIGAEKLSALYRTLEMEAKALKDTKIEALFTAASQELVHVLNYIKAYRRKHYTDGNE